jgi:signal transduction histidine kinase
MDQLTQLAELAASALDAPIAAINLVDDREVLTVAGVGVSAGVASPRELAVCAGTVAGSVPVIISDLARTPYGSYSTVVEQQLRFYAGWPLHLGGATAPSGTLCVMDRRPRRLSPAQKRTLDLLAGEASARLVRRMPGAEPAEQLRDDFIALISHEVRTPLASIQGYLELLLDDLPVVEPRHRRFASSIQTNVERLVRLIDQLLLTATATGGDLVLRRERIDLRALTTAVIDGVRPLADSGGVTLVAHDAGPAWFEGDRALLTQAVDNLVRNGVRYTAAGGHVDVTVTGAPVTVEVVDTGVGIPYDEQGRVFDRFFRGGHAELHAVPGAGLGLALVKAVAEAHGGHIDLASTPGLGTRVALAFP